MATLKLAKDLFDFFYPVGSYYETSNANWTPASAGWYGTWVEDTAGKTTVAKDNGTFATLNASVGSEGKSYTPAGSCNGHVLTNGQLPIIQGSLNLHGAGAGGTVMQGVSGCFTATTLSSYRSGGNNTAGATSTGVIFFGIGNNEAHNHGFTGSAATINVVQPSVVVRRWHRTA